MKEIELVEGINEVDICFAEDLKIKLGKFIQLFVFVGI